MNIENDKIDNVTDLNNFCNKTLIDRYKDITVNGYYILIFIFKPPVVKKSKGGIYIPDNAVEEDYEYRSTVGLVLKVGEDAYPEDRYPTGPWCKVGDWVTFPRANGVQFRCDGALLINVPDDKIINVIDDPRRISR
jgi:co-chaperonin GroES (HSP10)